MASGDGTRLIRSHFDWDVFKQAYRAAMEVFHVTKRFPADERYSLTDQVRRSSRSVSANLAEAWRRRRYEGTFLMRLNDAEAEAAETQTWLAFAVSCDYVKKDEVAELVGAYDTIIGTIVNMTRNPSPWLLQDSASARQNSTTKPKDPTTSTHHEHR